MLPAVALAVLDCDGAWLLQLRDDCDTIVAPGCWGLFGGHLEPGETPERALRRELLEEIGYRATTLEPWFRSEASGRVRHLFRGPLTVPLHELHLQEGQDMALVRPQALAAGVVWSPALQQHRPLAPVLLAVLERLSSP